MWNSRLLGFWRFLTRPPKMSPPPRRTCLRRHMRPPTTSGFPFLPSVPYLRYFEIPMARNRRGHFAAFVGNEEPPRRNRQSSNPTPLSRRAFARAHSAGFTCRASSRGSRVFWTMLRRWEMSGRTDAGCARVSTRYRRRPYGPPDAGWRVCGFSG